MGKIWLLAAFVSLFFGCTAPLDTSFENVRVDLEGDLETPFLRSGESRTIVFSMEREKWVEGHPTDKWYVVPASQIRVSVQDGPFRISDPTVLADNKVSFDISVPETPYEDTSVYELVIYSEENGKMTSGVYYALYQEQIDVVDTYRILSDVDNPFIIPIEGGEHRVHITVQSSRIIDGVPQEWLDTDIYSLRYDYTCHGAASHHSMRLVKEDNVGHYTLHLTSRPYYLYPGQTMTWGIHIWNPRSDSPTRLVQYFSHEPDRTLAEKGEPPAEGNDWKSGPLIDYEIGNF